MLAFRTFNTLSIDVPEVARALRRADPLIGHGVVWTTLKTLPAIHDAALLVAGRRSYTGAQSLNHALGAAGHALAARLLCLNVNLSRRAVIYRNTLAGEFGPSIRTFRDALVVHQHRAARTLAEALPILFDPTGRAARQALSIHNIVVAAAALVDAAVEFP